MVCFFHWWAFRRSIFEKSDVFPPLSPFIKWLLPNLTLKYKFYNLIMEGSTLTKYACFYGCYFCWRLDLLFRENSDASLKGEQRSWDALTLLFTSVSLFETSAPTSRGLLEPYRLVYLRKKTWPMQPPVDQPNDQSNAPTTDNHGVIPFIELSIDISIEELIQFTLENRTCHPSRA